MNVNTNLISITFSAEEIEDIKDSLDKLELIILSKSINLNTDERQFYGKLGKKTETWVQKVEHQMKTKPDSVPVYIDKPEFDRDLKSYQEILPMLERIDSLKKMLNDTVKLLSTDIYNAAIAYYRNIKVHRNKSATNAEIFNDLTKDFTGRNSTVPEGNEEK